MISEFYARVDSHMRLRYGVPLAEMDISDVPGYWRDKQEKMHPGHPLHSCLWCEGPFKSTYTFFDPPRTSSGRFSSQTRTWMALHMESILEKAAK